MLTGVAALMAVGGTVTHADEPTEPETTQPEIPEPDTSVPDSGEFEGSVVAVGLPPVPPTFVPDAEAVVAVGQPPVPTSTVPDAVADGESSHELSATGDATEATAIVAEAVAGVGTALTLIVRRV